MNKKWEYYSSDEAVVNKIQQNGKLNKLLATILANRGIVEEERIRKFLEPTRADFYNPFLMPDMEIAVNRIIEAMNQNEKIMIYGDYDVDGITSISVLQKFLTQRGMQVESYIPNRLEEGYGLNKEAIKEIHNKGYRTNGNSRLWNFCNRRN